MVSPEEDHAIGSSEQSLDSAARCLCKVKGGEVLERFPKIGSEIVAGWGVIRMSKDANVWVQRLERFPGVLFV